MVGSLNKFELALQGYEGSEGLVSQIIFHRQQKESILQPLLHNV